MKRRTFTSALLGMPFLAKAQSYPARNITLVVPFVPGGTTDIMARLLGQSLSEALKTPVVIENRGGAGGSIASEAVSKAPPDGYTLLMGHIGTLAVNPAIYPNLGYDPVKSFAPISLISRVHNVLVVKNDLPVKNVQELVAYARQYPHKLNYGSGGNGSAAHIATLALAQETNISLTHIPYRGTAPAVTDLLGGRLDMLFTGAPAILEQVKAGNARALAVSGLSPLKAAPDLPTLAYALNAPQFEASQWYGVVAPKETPLEIIVRLNLEIGKIMRLPLLENRLTQEGAESVISTPQEFSRFIAQEITRWGKVVKAAQVKAE
jgi:tripartite-type tricarboxylate transporter receptor subunit TctC